MNLDDAYFFIFFFFLKRENRNGNGKATGSKTDISVDVAATWEISDIVP